MRKNRRSNSKQYHNTVSNVILRKADKIAYGYGGKSTYTPYSEYMGYDPTAADRRPLIQRLVDQHKGELSEQEVEQKVKQELNRYKKGKRAWLKGSQSYSYKGERFWVDTRDRRSQNANEKLFPIVNTNQE